MVWERITCKISEAQNNITADKPFALSINRSGDDVSVVAIAYKKL